MADITEQLQRALDHAAVYGGTVLIGATAVVPISRTITIPPGVTLSGFGNVVIETEGEMLRRIIREARGDPPAPPVITWKP